MVQGSTPLCTLGRCASSGCPEHPVADGVLERGLDPASYEEVQTARLNAVSRGYDDTVEILDEVWSKQRQKS